MNAKVHDPFCVVDDPKLAFLDGLMQSGATESALQKSAPQLGNFRVVETRVVRHKPGRRCLIEFDVDHWPEFKQRSTWIGKVTAKRFDQSTFELVRQLECSGFHQLSPDGFTVPRPIAMVPTWHMWLQEKVPGISAISALTRQTDARLARRLADMLLKLHRTAPVPPQCHTMPDELNTLHKWLVELARIRPRWSRRLDRVFIACGKLADSVAQTSISGIHRDFHPEQVLVAGHRLYLLDLDLHCAGDPYLDAGNFLAHLVEHALRRPETAAALNNAALAFADQFLGNSNLQEPRALVAYGLLSFARLVGLSVRYPNRLPFAEQLLETCESCLFTGNMPAMAVA